MVRLRLERLGAHYGRQAVFAEVSAGDFLSGEVVAVIGPNAAGKSTLFKRMAALVDGPGQVVLEGSRLGRRGICYMPQHVTASSRLTVHDSVLLARKQENRSLTVRDEDLQVIDRILAALGIEGLAFRDLAELSGGQLQLVSIAQTLARDPEVMLMDEPTSALDLNRQVQVLKFVRGLAQRDSILVFVAMHDLNHALRFADKVLVMARGAVQACGPGREVITSDMLREVYGIRARVETCSRGLPHVIVDDIVDDA